MSSIIRKSKELRDVSPNVDLPIEGVDDVEMEINESHHSLRGVRFVRRLQDFRHMPSNIPDMNL